MAKSTVFEETFLHSLKIMCTLMHLCIIWKIIAKDLFCFKTIVFLFLCKRH